MGLISDPSKRKKLIDFLEKSKNFLSIFGYTGGIVWLFLLASSEFNSRAYVSENALLPGLVETSYSEDSVAFKLYGELKKICTKDIYRQRDWISQNLISAGLEVYHQNFSCGDKGVGGQNIYGILRSPRSSGVESLVLNVPQKYGCDSNGGLAMMLSIVRHFMFQNFWAKDIVFLITEHDSCGVEAWLGSYHGEPLKGVVASDLTGHAGKIQAALVIDFNHESFRGVDVQFEGINGLLPNLDLLHVVFHVARMEGVLAKLNNQDSYYGFADQFEDYKRCITSLCKMILRQATGFPSGVHGHYLKYRIEAVTLKESTTGERSNEARFGQVGRIIEGIFRSFNNLQEHFHQSFFMYLLPASDRYISIALYMPVLGGILLGPLLQAVSLWMQTIGMDIETDATDRKMLSAETIWHTLVLLLMSHSVGTILYFALPFAISSGSFKIGTSVEIAIGSWLVAVTLGYFQPTRNEISLKILKLVIIVYVTAVLTMTSLLNFSLALLVAVPLVPLIFCVDVQKDSKRFIAVLKYAFVLLLSPIPCVVLTCACRIVISGGHMDTADLLSRSLLEADYLIRYTLEKPYLTVWTWELLCLVILPIWVLISSITYPF